LLHPERLAQAIDCDAGQALRTYPARSLGVADRTRIDRVVPGRDGEFKRRGTDAPARPFDA
jgi:hypothetical protein